LEQNAKIIAEDAYFKFKVYQLEKGIPPGDSLKLSFQIKNQANDFFRRHSSVLANGSFLRSDILPRVGCYFADLPPEKEVIRQSSVNYQSWEADRLAFEVQLSTSSDQKALAPGSLIRSWKEDDRNYFQYKSDIPLKFSFGFLSARYDSVRLKKKAYEIELWHHPAHRAQISAMQEGVLAALEYNEAYFGPYPFSIIRVVEFPNSEGSFGTAFGNLLPISEARFVIAPSQDSLQIHLPFYVPAHEICHQWWGNQLLPAAAPGALFLTESICEYLSLNIYRRQYGTQAALVFLKKQQDRYWQGKKWDTESATPLSRVSREQSYLAYGKGAVALHTLAHYWGEDQLNRALKTFLDQYKNQSSPYPLAQDLINELKESCPDRLLYILEDYFEKDRQHLVSIKELWKTEKGKLHI
ncbi:MAG: M1 family aminopeptidase, partial [Bacteroidota bacterium]